jgi:hypothetical protein
MQGHGSDPVCANIMVHDVTYVPAEGAANLSITCAV